MIISIDVPIQELQTLLEVQDLLLNIKMDVETGDYEVHPRVCGEHVIRGFNVFF